jgi:hypothetical protein
MLMKNSPLDAPGLPGPSLIGYIACASVFRTSLYRAFGGYGPRLFIGGEETLVSLDVLSSGFAIVYVEELVLHHFPSPLRDSALRRRMVARHAWVAWIRLPLREAWVCTATGISRHASRRKPRTRCHGADCRNAMGSHAPTPSVTGCGKNAGSGSSCRRNAPLTINQTSQIFTFV